MTLTGEQLAIVESSGNVYVRACPGAGKTRTLVELAVRATADTPRVGVACLSFTNAARAEIRERLAVRAPRLLRAPSFVGTFDSFLIRHVLGPDGLTRAPGLRVQFRESWDQRIGFQTVQRGVPLDVFVPAGKTVRIDPAQAGGDYATRAILKKLTGTEERKLVEEAREVIAARLRAGITTARFLRSDAASRLANSAVAARAAARFGVVLVDEAQDCDALDIQIVMALLTAGCRCVLVADPEQGIFRWRGANPAALGGLGLADFTLTGNFRSTASICSASSSLRASALAPDTQQGTDRPDVPVSVLAYENKVDVEIGEAFSQLLRQHDIDPTCAIVVAHRDEFARSAVGAGETRLSKAGGAVIARAIAGTASVEDRNAGVEIIGEVLAASLGEEAPTGHIARWCRTTARQVLGMVAASTTAHGACARVRQALAVVRPPELYSFVQEPRKIFKARDPREHLTLLPDALGRELRYSTVHGVKGREFDAVLVVLPNDSHLAEFIDAWRVRDETHEGRAVVYVAATRARRLLVFAVPFHVSGVAAELLRRQGARVEEDHRLCTLHEAVMHSP